MTEMTKPLLLKLLDFRHDQDVGFAPLSRAVDGVSAQQACWRPNDQSHSIWELVNHIAYWNEYVLNRMSGSSDSNTTVDNEETFRHPEVSGDDSAWNMSVERTMRAFTQLRKTVNELNETVLNQPFDDDGTPLKVILGDIAMHDAYHVGQIMYIRKLQGLNGTSK